MLQCIRQDALRDNINGEHFLVEYFFHLLPLLAKSPLRSQAFVKIAYVPLTPGRAAARNLSKIVSARPQG